MNKKAYFKLSLQVRHPTSSAEQINCIFQLPAKISNSVGQVRKSRAGVELGGIYDKTYCIYSLETGPLNDLDNAIERGVKNIPLKQPNLDDAELTFSIGIFLAEDGGFVFQPSVLEKIAKLNVALSFDCYGPELERVPDRSKASD